MVNVWQILLQHFDHARAGFGLSFGRYPFGNLLEFEVDEGRVTPSWQEIDQILPQLSYREIQRIVANLDTALLHRDGVCRKDPPDFVGSEVDFVGLKSCGTAPVAVPNWPT